MMRRTGTAWPWSRQTGLWPLFLNQAFRAMAVYWLAFFSSVFVYKLLLKTTTHNQALAGAFFVWVFYGLGKLLATSLAENLSLKRGLKFEIKLGLFLMAGAFILFFFSTSQALLVLLAMFVWGTAAGTYWFGWHGQMAKLETTGRFGAEYGTSEFLMGVVKFLAPALGGLLITFIDYRGLFLAALGMIVLAILTLFPLEDKKTYHDATLKEVFGLFTTHKKVFLTYFSIGALGIIGASSLILYLALILGHELALGEFFSASLLLVAVIKWSIGKLIDLGQQSKILVLGSWGQALVWLGRALTGNVPLLLGLNVADDLSGSMMSMPLAVLSLKKGIDGHSMGRALLFREIAISLGYSVIALILAVLAWRGWPLTVGFALAIPLSLAPILIYKRD